MRVHTLEHAPNEGAGKIADWARARAYALSTTRLDLGQSLPTPGSFDLLVIMGGAMNIYQHRDYPWLRAEKALLAEAIQAQKAVLGVCLGAQMLADALGARVFQNAEIEIGWMPVSFTDRPAPFDRFPERPTVFHWHGDTFDLPAGARRIAQSEACANQAFIHDDRLVGLQFHVEVDAKAAAAFAADGTGVTGPHRFVHSAETIRSANPDLRETDAGLDSLLDALAATR
jgi:GMP synthase (glutamine-hydrolysing)